MKRYKSVVTEQSWVCQVQRRDVVNNAVVAIWGKHSVTYMVVHPLRGTPETSTK